MGVWYADTYTATPRPHVPNALATAPTGVSLLGPSRRRFSNTVFWNPSGATLTDDGFTAPDGRAEASRLVAGAGNWYMTTPALVVIPSAGNYTLCASVKRNAGSDQTFVMKFLTAGQTSPVKTAGSDWSRVTFTASLASGNQFVMPIADDGDAACDIQICDVELFQGSADLHEANAGHMMLGKYAGVSAPTYASGKLDFSSSALGYTQLLDAVSLSTVTAMAAVEKVAAGGTHHAFFADMRLNSWPQFSAMSEKGAQKSFWLGAVEFVPVVGGSGLWERLSKGVHMITCRFDGTRGEVWLDDHLMALSAQTPTGPTISDFFNYTLNGAIFSGDKMVGQALYNRALTDTEIRNSYNAFKARAALSSITMTGGTTNRIIAFEGESLTSGDGSITSYAMRYGPNSNPAIFGTNFAVGGSYIGTTATNMQARAASLDRILPAQRNGRKFILSVQISNDLLSRTTTQYLDDLAAYLAARRAAGWDKIVICTILPRTNGTFNTARNIVNPILRTWAGTTNCDAVVDFAADATIGADAHASDVAKYGDGTHPTNATQILMETIARPVYDAL